jgi:hypothetical protein
MNVSESGEMRYFNNCLIHSTRLLLCLAVCFFWADRVEAEDTKTLDFIYVNANTGEAAGGHTAIRLGSTVFHFQFFPEGRFLLVRESWSHFRYVYNELRNRSIFIARIPLTPSVYHKVRNNFTNFLIEQQQDLDQLQRVEDQWHLLAQLVGGAMQLELETVGLFDLKSDGDVDKSSLHQAIQKQLGDNYVSTELQKVEIRLANLVVDYGKQTTGISWIARLQNTILERESLQILEAGLSLAPDSIFGPPQGAPELTSEQRHVLEEYREKLAESIIGLLQSRRPDRARSLLLQTARYQVVNRSLATGTLLTLDPFSSRANLVPIKQKDGLPGLHAQLQQNAVQAQRNFYMEKAHPDIAYTIMETALARLHELENALHDGSPVRVEPGKLLPSRKGYVSLSKISIPRSRLHVLVVENEEQLGRLRQQVDRKYSYDLIARNCATELLRLLNSSFLDSAIGQSELGGWLAPEGGLIFIPNQFYLQVDKHFSVQEKDVFLSRRLRQLNELNENGNALAVKVRESNTFSSTLYMRRNEDTTFIFFTDDAWLLRPIFGVINLLWGATNGIGGLFIMPIDGGERFYQGLRGIFYSIPELFFSNIRKGTYGFAEAVIVRP